jgi:phosphoribosylformylglycinamidine synthase subunit PurQ / glutaminase
MKFGIIVFPGSNCDRDVAWVTQGLLNQTTRMIWHEEQNLSDLDVVVIPGGFSYGDYLRCGAIARFSPAIRATIEHAQRGGLVLGICNGFQVLTEAGLLPGALVRNQDLHFICDRVALKVERTDLPWTQAYQPGEIITLPIAHGEGCYYADAETLTELEDNQQILFRYSDTPPDSSDKWQVSTGNPNGSLHNIAGICNRQGNVLGMMPHPERAADAITPNVDGRKLFESLLTAAVAAI